MKAYKELTNYLLAEEREELLKIRRALNQLTVGKRENTRFSELVYKRLNIIEKEMDRRI